MVRICLFFSNRHISGPGNCKTPPFEVNQTMGTGREEDARVIRNFHGLIFKVNTAANL